MTMKSFVTEGTVELVACETCQQLVPATYSLGPVEHEGLIVEDVMRAICNQCGDIIATTPQSAHRFREASQAARLGSSERRRRFFDRLDSDYENLSEQDLAEMKQEHAEWDATLSDGLPEA